MSELHLALADELEKLAGEYRAMASRPQGDISIQEISSVLAEKANKGKLSAIKALLKKHGAAKLVDVKPEDYVRLIEEAKNL
ncbi:MAG: hypothetical protein SCK57_10425 [Bacillota bacterium]|nr:hypothetical protein [Bacillota bacterium]MDW7678064.1 hypothetical protein [Bacillota bacterium]